MTLKTDATAAHGSEENTLGIAPAGGLARLMADANRFGIRIALDEPNEGGTGGDPDPENPDPENPDPENPDPQDPPVDPKKKDDNKSLLAEVMAKKKEIKDLQKQLKAFDGIDLNSVKELIAEKAKAKEDADKAEQEKLEKAGEWDRLKTQMKEQHTAALKDLTDKLTESTTALTAAQEQINELTIGSDFMKSKFIGEELVLTPIKARVLYGAHFERDEHGHTVGYDKPKGAKDRTLLVDGDGDALGFEAAIKKLIEADPEKDTLLKSKLKPGSGSSTTDTRTTTRKPGDSDTEAKKKGGLYGASRMAAALDDMKPFEKGKSKTK